MVRKRHLKTWFDGYHHWCPWATSSLWHLCCITFSIHLTHWCMTESRLSMYTLSSREIYLHLTTHLRLYKELSRDSRGWSRHDCWVTANSRLIRPLVEHADNRLLGHAGRAGDFRLHVGARMGLPPHLAEGWLGVVCFEVACLVFVCIIPASVTWHSLRQTGNNILQLMTQSDI